MTLALAWAALRRHAVILSCTHFLVACSARLIGAFARASATLRPRPLSVDPAKQLVTAWVGQVGALVRPPKTARQHPVTGLCSAFLFVLSATSLATVVLLCRAVRRHPLTVCCSALLLVSSASLAGASVPLALLLWACAAVVCLAIWRTVEPVVLRRLGCRLPGHLDRERLDPARGAENVDVLILDQAQPWLGRGARTVVLTRGLLDLLEDPALAGLLAQASAQTRAASLPGELVVWLGNLPLLGVWCLSHGVMQLGRLLAIAVGTSLVVPMVFWPDGFTRWAGRFFGAAGVGLLGTALVSRGLSAAGVGLLLAWAVVPGLHALLDWETRRAEAAADDAAFGAGRGWELLEALETLSWAESVLPPAPPLGWLGRAATPLTDRADRIWRKLAQL